MTEPETTKRGWTVPVLSGIATLLAVAMLVVPGYIAGYYCRLAHDTDSMVAIEWHGFPGVNWPNKGLAIFLAPAWVATKVAPPLRGIYLRQFYLTAHIDPRYLYYPVSPL